MRAGYGMATTAIQAAVCSGVRRARDAARDNGQVSDSEINAVLRIGDLLHSLPGDTTRTAEVIAALTELALEFDPRLLDEFPILETSFGNIPVPYILRCKFLETVAHDAEDPAKTKAGNLLRAASSLEERLRVAYHNSRR